MIHEEKRTKPASEYTVVTGVTCDCCKKLFAEALPDSWSGIKWEGDGHDELATCLRLTTGWSSSDGGSKSHREYHVCPQCFEEKIEPVLKSLGIEPRMQEIDW